MSFDNTIFYFIFLTQVRNCSSFTALLLSFEVWSEPGICIYLFVYGLIENVILAAAVVALLCILSLFV